MTSKTVLSQKEQKCGQAVIYCAYIVKGGVRIYPRRAKAFRIVLSH